MSPAFSKPASGEVCPLLYKGKTSTELLACSALQLPKEGQHFSSTMQRKIYWLLPVACAFLRVNPSLLEEEQGHVKDALEGLPVAVSTPNNTGCPHQCLARLPIIHQLKEAEKAPCQSLRAHFICRGKTPALAPLRASRLCSKFLAWD